MCKEAQSVRTGVLCSSSLRLCVGCGEDFVHPRRPPRKEEEAASEATAGSLHPKECKENSEADSQV